MISSRLAPARGAELLRLGCAEAINLDGGGSSVFALRDPASGTFQILNQPTDGHERPVANALGVSVVSPKPLGAKPR